VTKVDSVHLPPESCLKTKVSLLKRDTFRNQLAIIISPANGNESGDEIVRVRAIDDKTAFKLDVISTGLLGRLSGRSVRGWACTGSWSGT
jgi:hypothetical protein